jgi:hypothetical protein
MSHAATNVQPGKVSQEQSQTPGVPRDPAPQPPKRGKATNAPASSGNRKSVKSGTGPKGPGPKGPGPKGPYLPKKVTVTTTTTTTEPIQYQNRKEPSRGQKKQNATASQVADLVDQVVAAEIVAVEKAEEAKGEEPAQPEKQHLNLHMYDRQAVAETVVCEYPLDRAQDYYVAERWDRISGQYKTLGKKLGDTMFGDASSIGKIVLSIGAISASIVGAAAEIVEGALFRSAATAAMAAEEVFRDQFCSEVTEDDVAIQSPERAQEGKQKQKKTLIDDINDLDAEYDTNAQKFVDGIQEMSQLCSMFQSDVYTAIMKEFLATTGDLFDIQEWYSAHRHGRDTVHADVVLLWVPDKEQLEEHLHTSHYNLSDRPLPVEKIIIGQYVVRAYILDTDGNRGGCDLIRPRILNLPHLGLKGCMVDTTTLTDYDSFKNVHISQSVLSNVISWRCNRTVPKEDLIIRARAALNSLPNSTFLDRTLLHNQNVMDDTWSMLSMHLSNDPWSSMDQQTFLN